MTILMMDGFDLFNGVGTGTGLQGKFSVNTTAGLSLTTGRFGGQCVRAIKGNVSGISIYKATTGASTVSTGFAVRFNSTALTSNRAGADSNAGFCQFRNSSTVHCMLALGAGGTVRAYYPGTAGNTDSASAVFVADTWHYIEASVTVHDTTGSILVKVDGVTALNLTGIDTRNGATTTIDQVALTSQAFITTGNSQTDFDDWYITDGASLGEQKIEVLYPASDVAQGFARSTGSTNYTLVDEAQANGDTDYVQGSTVGDVDTYGMGDLSSTPTSIQAAQLTAFAEKTDAGSRSIALQAKSGATTSDGSNFALGASYQKLDRIMETDPNTSTAWTAAGINALQGGPKVTV